MSLCACIVIPIYNHDEAIAGTLARLVPHGLPVIVVDDGSNDATQRALAALRERYAPQVTVLRLPENGGKGAAVMAGLRAARAAGYSHALQIDADGQHDAADVPRFLAAANEHPGALILGRPVYDESVPKSRLYGRYVTHVWVWIETLSLEIRDSMCGFRLYPLDAACALIDSVRLGTRMDFDIEILVRLFWCGMRFESIPTRVTYAADGVSHFDVLRDNVRISATHARLVFGMLWRAPLLLGRRVLPRRAQKRDEKDKGRDSGKDSGDAARWWRIGERGSSLGIGLLALCCRVFGVGFTSLWLHPVVAYFVLTGGPARAASHRYFAQLAEVSPPGATPRPGWTTAYRHMLAFARSGLDKLAAWTGRVPPDAVSFDDTSAFDELVASGKGALVIGAHLGNLEMTRALAARGNFARVTAIVYTGHARRFNSMLAHANESFRLGMLEIGDVGPETALLMQERIDAGELLVMVGDRVPANESGRTVDARFLGADAPFAQGPYVLAHLLGCPVYLFFCIREAGRYRLYFERFAERIELPRGERAGRIARHAQQYAARLEHYCRKAPYQWFNFYDFWHRPAVASSNAKTLRHGRT
jgi:predicted LPLAT superfamily acyltransferase/glycosyltransferase involved in cell wall biosynthesis